MDWLGKRFSQLRNLLRTRVVACVRKREEQQKLSIRSHVAHIQIGNFLVSVSTTGLMALGVVPMSLTVLIVLAIFLFLIGVIGRYIDSVEDDVERLLKYEEHIGSSVVGSDASASRHDSVQQQSD